MLEGLLVLLGLGLLVSGTLIVQLMPAERVVQASWVCSGIGLLVGLPTGFWYHVKLRACLQRAGELPPRWWLRPVAHHGYLTADDRPAVMFWFTLGGAGFGLTMLGCVGVGAGVLLQGWRAGVF
jgi:hypothetical protein